MVDAGTEPERSQAQKLYHSESEKAKISQQILLMKTSAKKVVLRWMQTKNIRSSRHNDSHSDSSSTPATAATTATAPAAKTRAATEARMGGPARSAKQRDSTEQWTEQLTCKRAVHATAAYLQPRMAALLPTVPG